MKGTDSAKHPLARLLTAHAAGRLRRDYPEWAAAMVSEGASGAPDDEPLRWAAGCCVASYRASGVFDGAFYPAALAAGIALITAYQWSADESPRTVVVLSLVGLALGVLHPRRCLISGAAAGSVVAAVNGFETLTGVRPAYEAAAHGLLHDARWLMLLAPALLATAIGGYAGGKLRRIKEASA